MNNINNLIDLTYENIKNEIEYSLSENNIERAKFILNNYKSKFSEDSNTYCIEGVIHINENNIEKAFECFIRGLEIDNKNKDILYNLGYLANLIGDKESAINYYNECLKYTNETEVKKEIEYLIKDLKSHIEEEKTIITLGLEKYENSVFIGRNKLINIIINNNIKYEHRYERDNTIIYEVNNKKIDDLIGYLIRRNSNPIIIFKDIFRSDIIDKFKENAKIAYYINYNYYAQKINYYRNSRNLFFEKLICNKVDYIFTDDITIYNYKKIIEERDNIYFIDNKVDDVLGIDSIISNGKVEDTNYINVILKEYISNLDDEYEKSLYLLASEANDIDNCIEIARYIYEKYKTFEIYNIYVSLLNKKELYIDAIIVALNSEYCKDYFKAELIYLNGIEDKHLISFLIDLSIKNYRIVDEKLNNSNYLYKVSAYNFEIDNKDEAFNKYTELFNKDIKFKNSPMLNRNISQLLYLRGDISYKIYEEFYNEVVKGIFSNI